ncbi:MAG: VOC family protein [Propionicimonas sp.]|nr:VOC family protein [Propionicimonas sp.]
MTVRPAQVSVDCADPFALADWWRDRLGWRDVWRTGVRAHAIIGATDGSGWQLCFIRVPDPTPGKNKLHLDLTCADRETEAAAFEAAGARILYRDAMEDYGWITLADPEGNLFCISSRDR